MNTEVDESTPDWWDEPDTELQVIVEILNRNPTIGFGLTLTVGGSQVTGTAVGAAAYWQILVEQDKENGDGSGLREYFLDNARRAVARESHQGQLAAVTFIHLVDSAHWPDASGCLPTDQRATWRGRLSEVQGWTFGRLGPPLDPSSTIRYMDALSVLQGEIDKSDALEDESESA